MQECMSALVQPRCAGYAACVLGGGVEGEAEGSKRCPGRKEYSPQDYIHGALTCPGLP